MIDTFTLTELASPFSPVSSSMTFGVSMKMDSAKSFSCPPFIYYALKAKTLAGFGKLDERELNPKEAEAMGMIAQSLRTTAKDLYTSIQSQDFNMDNHMSTCLQDLFLSQLLNEPMGPLKLVSVHPAVQINVTRAKKNISIPHYLMVRLEKMLGSESSARQFIHNATVDIKELLVNGGGVDSSGKLRGDAANSSWSRKVHNQIILFLLQMSPLPSILSTPSMLDVRLVRESKRETKKGL